MSLKKIYDLAVVTGGYKDRDGKDKKKYLNVGVVLESSDGGRFMLLDRTFSPAGVPGDITSPCLVSMFPPKQSGAFISGSNKKAGENPGPDDVPF